MKKLSRRQAVALAVTTMAVGMTVAKPAVAKLTKAQWKVLLKDPAFRQRVADSMVQPKRCGGLDYSSRLLFDNLQDLLVSVIGHTKRTGDRILEANDPDRRVFGWIAVPRDGGWPSEDYPKLRWEITITRIIRTGNRMDPRFKEAIVRVTNDPSWMMTGEKRRDFNARMHLVQIPPNLAPCVPSRKLWDPYVDGPLAPLHQDV